MKEVQDRVVQFSNRYKLTNVETGEVLGTFDFDEITGTVQQVGTEIDAELFQSIANDLAARVVSAGGELSGTIVTFSDISGTAENVASGDTSATLWGKVKNWFSRLKALAFKNKVAAGDFEAGAIKNADVAADAAIAQSKVSGLMTDYVASISVSGRTVTYKNKNGVDMGSITTQDTTYGLASQSSNGLMSSTDKTKLDGIESGAQKNTVLGVKGGSESAYRTGNVNITKANIGLGNVDNTSDEDKPVSAATQMALNGKANTSGTYLNLTVGKATNADNATNATNATNAQSAAKATQDGDGNVISSTYATKAENAAKYTKPSAGIPATDLSSDVQADLEAGATAYQKPSTGIPQSDLANAVQEKLDAVPAPSAANDGNLLSVQDGAYELVDPANVTVGNATNDGNGDNIADTYQKKEAGVAFAQNALEIGNQDGSPNNANIDFHTDGTTKDFNSRLVARGNTNDLEVQVGSGGSFRVPSGQTFLPNADNSAKAATTEFLKPAVVFAQGDGPQSYGYRGKTYNVSLNTGTFTTSGGGNFIVVRSGNTVVVSGWLQNRVKMPLTSNYTLLSNLPRSVGLTYGPVVVHSHIGLGRVWIDFNSKTLNISIDQCLNYADGLPANSYMSFCVTYITND